MDFYKLFFAAFFLVVLFPTAQAQDTTSNSFGNGLINVIARDSSYSARFGVRFQTLFAANWNHPEDERIESAGTNFLIRRARLKFDGFVYTPRLKYKIELGLSNRDLSGPSVYNNNTPRLILDAVAKWNFYGNFELWAGQTKLPGNRERVVSSANLELVDRSLLNSEYNIDRDLGIQLHHKMDLGNEIILREVVSIAQGEGRNVTSGNLGGYQYTGRLEIFPLGDFTAYSGADLKRHQTPKLAVGVTFDHNDNAVRTRSNSGAYMITEDGFYKTDINTLFLDFMFKYKGISIMGEYADRNADNPVALDADGTPTGDFVEVGSGLNLQAGYLFKNNYQLVGRFTQINPDDFISRVVETQYTLGLSKYIVGHKLKVQTDISYNDLTLNQNDGLMYRFQFEIHL
ncbi:OprO/OprP family phosphate-selective porin [Antarcticibacterium sp. 1MA-6-2]|uniref:porin n=1 Tax=Antarcticibacterium sp. 1MA-6-2 TaxID=2908210 RepID=UPI001F24F155|nr:porin [Antarcticibacterium sp. 1MA-6-2]UJH92368.1 OprO/OprP family phosphate-selective porin [Antarcticibacterium sp. 1MA-6-2]